MINEELVSDYKKDEENKISEIKKLENAEYGEEEPDFEIDTFDFILVLMIYQRYLFCNGYVRIADKLFILLFERIQKYSLHKSLIKKDAQLSLLIHAFTNEISLPLPNITNIFVIGCNSLLPMAFKTIHVHGKDCLLKPIIIPEISYLSLTKDKNSIVFQFSKIMNSLPKKSEIILAFGEEDVKYFSIEMKNQTEFKSFEEAFGNVISLFIMKLEEIIKDLNIFVYIHPVPVLENKNQNNTILFNKSLKECMQNVDLKNIFYLDFEEKIIENQTIKKEFCYSRKAWNSTYLKYVEECINALEQTPINRNK